MYILDIRCCLCFTVIYYFFMNISETLEQYGVIGVEVLKQAIADIEASGRTANSIRYEVTTSDTKDRLTFYGRAYFDLIEKGIRPSGKNPSPGMIAFLTEYARNRGMENPESAAWAIAKTILKEGDKTHRQGGRVVYSDDLAKFVDELKQAIAKQVSKGFLTEVVGAFKSGSSN